MFENAPNQQEQQEVYCSQCQRDVVVNNTTQEFDNGTTHLRGECSICGRFLKFMPKGTPPTFHFGKYKGKTMAEVAKEDRAYLEWWLTQDIKSEKMRRDIETSLLNN